MSLSKVTIYLLTTRSEGGVFWESLYILFTFFLFLVAELQRDKHLLSKENEEWTKATRKKQSLEEQKKQPYLVSIFQLILGKLSASMASKTEQKEKVLTLKQTVNN